MPTFLADPPSFLFLFLGIVVILAGAVWSSRRERNSLIVFAVSMLLVLLLLLLDQTSESPREEAVRRVMAMVNAADKHDPEGFVNQLADTFEYQTDAGKIALSREQIRKANFWNVLKQYNVHVAAWDFARADVKQLDSNTIEIGFLGKGEADGKQFPMYFRATFARQPSGEMKLVALGSFDPLKRQNERKAIPQFP